MVLGRKDARRTFFGKLTNLNIWNKSLDNEILKDLSNCGYPSHYKILPDILIQDVEAWTLDNSVEEIFRKESPCNQITESHYQVLIPHGADF